jgi:protein regulator of cytokinesis 1
MDTSFLAQQVTTIISQLHSLFDEIGVPSHEREAREAEASRSACTLDRLLLTTVVGQLFSALSETLNNQVRQVTAEKKDMVQEAQKIITTIRQMEASLDDTKGRREYSDDDDLNITYPLTRSLQYLKEKHTQISRLHKDRFEQVKSW